MIWVDKIAEELMKRGKEHVIETGTSISGIPHIGNASDIIRGDVIRKVLEENGIKVELIWIADDSDPFRRLPKGMENLERYLGFPVSDIPDLDGCHKNFVEHLVEPFLKDLERFGVKPRVYSGTELYRSGEFYSEIRTALQNSERITRILNEHRAEPLPENFIPWRPICENCGKISTTRVIGTEKDIVRYVCEDVNLPSGRIEGCKHKGESDIRRGYGKLVWRVEWAARWKHFRVTCEPLGKEHATAGGSFSTAKEISRDIFGWEAPLPVIYEFFTLNGEKISSSKGNVITLSDWLQIAEPEVLRFFMYKRLQKQRDINLAKISNLVDEYDEAERIYFGFKEGNEKDRRRYELAQINKPRFLGIPFTTCVVLSQINIDMNEILTRLRKQGYEDFDPERLKERLRLAENWGRNYCPEYLRFRIISDEDAVEFKKQLNEKQISALRILADELDKEWKPEELHRRIYQISREKKLEPARLFEAIYLSLIGKKKGPRAAMFLLSLDKEFVKKRLKNVF